jgi:hypothetical protein
MTRLALIALTFLIPVHVFAASLSSLPASISTMPGQSFTLSLIASPASAAAGGASSTIVSIRAHVVFDPAVLQEESFSFAPGWLALDEPGYSLVNNEKGSVTETAGYPRGFTGPTPFATVTFKAKAAGTSSLFVAGDTLMLDGAAANQFGGTARGTLVRALPRRGGRLR